MDKCMFRRIAIIFDIMLYINGDMVSRYISLLQARAYREHLMVHFITDRHKT